MEFKEDKDIKVTIDDTVVAQGAEIGIDVVSEVKSAIAKAVKEEADDEPEYEGDAEVYSKPNCPYCVKAKHLLQKRNWFINEKSAVDARDELFEKVTAAIGQPPRTVPQIWLNGEYIGGYDQLVAHFNKLDENKGTL